MLCARTGFVCAGITWMKLQASWYLRGHFLHCCPVCCSLKSVLEGERQEFEAACAKYEAEKQALMAKVQARRDLVRQVVEGAVLPAADSPARWLSQTERRVNSISLWPGCVSSTHHECIAGCSAAQMVSTPVRCLYSDAGV